MYATAFNRTWQQLLHPTFRKVFLISVAVAAATLGLLVWLSIHYWPDDYTTGYAWLDNAGFALVTGFASYLLFPPIVSGVMGLLVDQIVEAVEDEYYPDRLGTRKIPVMEVCTSAIKLTAIVLLVNLLALIPYTILLFTTGGVGTLMLFLAINGYLIGREYFEMVTMKHMPVNVMHKFKARYKDKVYVTGILIAGLFLVPFLNILAPILGVAIMTHMVHAFMSESAARTKG